MLNLFDAIYSGRRVLVTGHTGFKGSWLSFWLRSLEAEVTGYSLYRPSTPCNFDALGMDGHMVSIEGDIRDIKGMRSIFEKYRPEIVFHLAAQPIVKLSYDDPKTTFDTNVGGTVNVLECIRNCDSVRAAVMITSDKCYDNVEWLWGYRENDRLGGCDPYSASKAAAELVVNAYCRSFFGGAEDPAVATTRAGNVIGGGDWAADRIIPDCIRAWTEGVEVITRSPKATRPWQHVLEPLSGYLALGAGLWRDRGLHNEAFNFGPRPGVAKSVGELISAMGAFWKGAQWREVPEPEGAKESTLLQLNCEKAMHMLKWQPAMNFDETVQMTAEWYRTFYKNSEKIVQFTREQLSNYVSIAADQKIAWALEGA